VGKKKEKDAHGLQGLSRKGGSTTSYQGVSHDRTRKMSLIGGGEGGSNKFREDRRRGSYPPSGKKRGGICPREMGVKTRPPMQQYWGGGLKLFQVPQSSAERMKGFYGGGGKTVKSAGDLTCQSNPPPWPDEKRKPQPDT